MKKQIIQILYNLIGKGIRPDGKADGSKSDPEMSHVAEAAETGGAQHDASAVQVVDQKTLERIVNENLSAEQSKGCLLACNADRFRQINDIYGRDTGDLVLRYMADILCDVFRECDCIAGLGGDRFAVWLSAVSRDNVDKVRRQVGVVNDRLLHPTGGLPPVSMSVGAAFCKTNDDYKNLGKRANKALNLVKGSGRCGCEMSL